jgi:hypothetical protein
VVNNQTGTYLAISLTYSGASGPTSFSLAPSVTNTLVNVAGTFVIF